MSRKKVFQLLIDDYTNEALTKASLVFQISKSKIVNSFIPFEKIMELSNLTKLANKTKPGTREYKVIERNFHRFLIGFPPEEVTCDEIKEQKLNKNL
jgi:hypothetical protein